MGLPSVGRCVFGWRVQLCILLVAMAQVDSLSRPSRSVPTSQEAQSLLDLHNNYRRQEGSSNMIKLKWNSVLAEMGDEWSSSCDWEHGQPSSPFSPFGSTGQNLYATTASGVNLTKAVVSWYNEKADYNYAGVSCSKVCGHYTQVVWATSQEVGCGYHRCNPLSGSGLGGQAWFITCNYGPAGNWRGESPYLKGAACSACPAGYNYCDNGLCVESDPVTTKSPTTAAPTTKSPTTTTSTPTTTSPTTSRPTSTTTHATTRAGTDPTTTTMPTTTTTICGGVRCLNGGIQQLNAQMICGCRCTAQWQGSRCEESRVESKIGVLVLYGGPDPQVIFQFWSLLATVITDFMNDYCNKWPSLCCGDDALGWSSPGALAFMTENDILLGAGYPKAVTLSGRETNAVLIYALGRYNNQLCSAVRNNGRKRRETDIDDIENDIAEGFSVHQDTFLDMMNKMTPDLQQIFEQYNVTMEGVIKGKEEPVIDNNNNNDNGDDNDDDDDDDDGLGFSTWAIIMAGVAFVLLVLLVFVAVFLSKRSRPSKPGNPHHIKPSYVNQGYASWPVGVRSYPALAAREPRPAMQTSPDSFYSTTQAPIPAASPQTPQSNVYYLSN